MTTSDRMLNVLGLFALEHPEWTVEGAAQELGLAVSTAYRYFRSLSKAGLIVAASTGRYVLGPAIIEFDRQIRLRDPLTTAAQPVMKRLTENVPPCAVVLLCRLFRNQVMCIHQETADRPDFAISYERGRAMPLYRGASSKIILANLPLRTVKSIHEEYGSRFAQAALGRNWEETKDRLRALRGAGFAVTQGDLDPGMCGIAAPVFETDGAVVGSLSFVIPVRHLTPEFLAAAPLRLKESAEQIRWALSLGAQPPISPKSAEPPPASARAPGRGGVKPRQTATPTRGSRKARRRARV
jgi:DNA-binding IclR family transcriptional regulator